MMWAILLIVLLLQAALAEAATKYVDPACSNGITTYNPTASPGSRCTGGSATSYNTVPNGLDGLVQGQADQLFIRSGSYTVASYGGNGVASKTYGGGTSWETASRISNYPGETVTLTAGGFNHSTNAKYVIWEGDDRTRFIVQGRSDGGVANGVGFRVASDGGPSAGHHIRFKNMTVKNYGDNGLMIAQSPHPHHVEVIGNYVWNNGDVSNADHGIYVSTGDDILIEYNHFVGNQGYGVHAYGGSEPFQHNRITIRYNRIEGRRAGATSTGFGIVVSTGSGHKIHNNLIIGRGSIAGEDLQGCIYIGGAGGGFQVSGTEVYNNTCDGQNATNFGYGIAVDNKAPNTIIKNNLLYRIPIAALQRFSNPTGLVVDHNLCDISTCDATAGVATNTVVSSTPGFVSPTTDYSLASGSAAINTGVVISGFPFNGTLPDIGAFETFGCTLATASGNAVDVTCQMNLNVPIQPATGQTTWVVKFSGTPRTTVSAGKLTPTDSVVRIQYDGAACEVSSVMTVDFTSGSVSDSVNIGGTANQKLHSFTGLAVDESNCGGTPPPPPSGPHIVYHLNDGSGTTVTDSSGNANHGTTTGSPAWVTGLLDGALDLADATANYATLPYGSGVNPTSQSMTYCVLVAPDSINPGGDRILFGPPLGTNQRGYLGISGGTWSIGIQSSFFTPNSEFPVQSGYSLPCIIFNAATDKATLVVNGVFGTTENGTTGASVKPYTSYTFAGNVTVGAPAALGSTLGSVVDEIFVYEFALNQTEMTELYQSLINPSPPPPSSTREQKGHKFQRPFKKAGAAEDLRGVDEDGRVSRGGYVDVVIQLDCTGDDCPSFAPRIHRSIDGGATYAQINDVCGVICFAGTSTNPDLVSADVTCCLTGALTANNGPTNFTSAAIPNVDLAEDASITLRYKLKIASDATVGQEIYLKVYDQNGNELEGGYTPALGAKLTVKDYANGGGF